MAKATIPACRCRYARAAGAKSRNAEAQDQRPLDAVARASPRNCWPPRPFMCATACSRAWMPASSPMSPAISQPPMARPATAWFRSNTTFKGITSHAAGSPWEGRSALDAVEIMNVAMNYRREHLPLSQRTHYVVSNGGGQPNIVPGIASVWYYFRDYTFDRVKRAVRDRQQDRRGRRHGHRHHRHAQAAGLCRAQLRQQAAGRTAHGEYRKGRHAANGPPTTRPSPSWCRKPRSDKVEPLRDKVSPLRAPVEQARAHRRRLGRYRRYHVDRADHHRPLPVQHSHHDRPQCDRGHGDGHAYSPQGARWRAPRRWR